ncbi:MAG TPA: hypothetical protein VGN17_05390 [Bryobacteraceae bacterium]|jgi:hypothetical protein
MAAWVDTLCEKEDFENSKKRHITSLNQQITDALKRELDTCIAAYNKKHPQQQAVTAINAISNGFELTVRMTTTNPSRKLTITFPLNDRKLGASGTHLSNGGLTYLIDPEVRDERFVASVEAVFFLRGARKHRVPELVEELVAPFLFPEFAREPE